MSSIPRKWCLLSPDGNSLVAFMEGGEIRSAESGNDARNLLLWCEEFACFSGQPKAVMALCDARYFTVKQRRQRLLEIRPDDGPKICALPVLPISDDPFLYALAFSTYCEWLQSIGVVFDKRAGWSTIGRRIWKLTDGEQKFSGPVHARLALYGGRKQAPHPATFRLAQHFDISAAYLSALGPLTIPRRLRSAPPGEWKAPELDGLAFASITIPDDFDGWNPLPERADKRIVRMLRFPSGGIQGLYPFSELRMAAEYGCKIKAIESWAGQFQKPYFGQWHMTMLEGRQLPHGASLFAKQHANLLWSSFATSAARTTIKRFRDEYALRPYIIKENHGRDFSLFTAYVAAIISARVREKLYRDALCPDGESNPFILHCDTDGIITGSNHRLPDRLRNASTVKAPGEWRLNRALPLVEIKSSNTYRYTCNDCGFDHSRWHYVCAGMNNPDSAKRLFEKSSQTSQPNSSSEGNMESLPDTLIDYQPKRRVRKYEH